MTVARRMVYMLCALAIVAGIGQAAFGADWPCYRGPDHNGISKETDWSSDRGQAGPKALWKKSVGIGFSTTAVADDRVYTMGKSSLTMSEDGRMILTSDKGELVVAKAAPQKFDVVARAQALPKGLCWTSPVLANGRIYVRNTPGDFACLDVGGK